jgi:hypothetical protein
MSVLSQWLLCLPVKVGGPVPGTKISASLAASLPLRGPASVL